MTHFYCWWRSQFEGLLNGNGFCQVSGLVYVAASADGYVVGEELEGDYFEDGQELFGDCGM